MGDRHEASIRKKLETLADAGVSLPELDAELKRHDLSTEEYDELWLYAWTLLERRASRVVIGANGTWYGYDEIDE